MHGVRYPHQLQPCIACHVTRICMLHMPLTPLRALHRDARRGQCRGIGRPQRDAVTQQRDPPVVHQELDPFLGGGQLPAQRGRGTGNLQGGTQGLGGGPADPKGKRRGTSGSRRPAFFFMMSASSAPIRVAFLVIIGRHSSALHIAAIARRHDAIRRSPTAHWGWSVAM